MNKINSSEKEIQQFLKKIGKNVAKERIKKNLTQLELAQALNYKSVSTISNSEIYYNKTSFNLKQLYKISKILNISIHDLIPKN